MTIRNISTTDAPATAGPYAQGVRAGAFVFTSGQLPIDPQTGQVVKGDIAIQTRQVLNNLKAVLATEDLTCADVVKTTIYVTDIGHFSLVNQVYAEYFPSDPPARSTIEVASLPIGVAIEIEFVAYAGSGR